MKKQELVSAIQLELYQKVAKKVIEEIIDVLPQVIVNDLQENPETSTKLGPFTFKVKDVAERTYPAKVVTLRGIETEIKETTIPEHKKIVVNVSKAVRSF